MSLISKHKSLPLYFHDGDTVVDPYFTCLVDTHGSGCEVELKKITIYKTPLRYDLRQAQAEELMRQQDAGASTNLWRVRQHFRFVFFFCFSFLGFLLAFVFFWRQMITLRSSTTYPRQENNLAKGWKRTCLNSQETSSPVSLSLTASFLMECVISFIQNKWWSIRRRSKLSVQFEFLFPNQRTHKAPGPQKVNAGKISWLHMVEPWNFYQEEIMASV